MRLRNCDQRFIEIDAMLFQIQALFQFIPFELAKFDLVYALHDVFPLRADCS